MEIRAFLEKRRETAWPLAPPDQTTLVSWLTPTHLVYQLTATSTLQLIENYES